MWRNISLFLSIKNNLSFPGAKINLSPIMALSIKFSFPTDHTLCLVYSEVKTRLNSKLQAQLIKIRGKPSVTHSLNFFMQKQRGAHYAWGSMGLVGTKKWVKIISYKHT